MEPFDPKTRAQVTESLSRISAGDEAAEAWLQPIVYAELRRIAASFLGRERSDHTLQPTALVHEAWMRVADQKDANLECRAHFRAVASGAMRRILVDHARSKNAQKRGADAQRVTLSDVDANDPDAGLLDVLDLDGALNRLAEVSPRQAKVIEMRFFGELTMEEVAASLGVSLRTVHGDWRVARAWLSRELEERAD